MNILKIIPLRVNVTLLLMLSVYCLKMQIVEGDRNLIMKTISKRTKNRTENEIFSTFSIHTCLTLLFLGARGETEKSLRTGLELGNATRNEIVNAYHRSIDGRFNISNDKNAVQLRMVNRIYIQEGYQINPEFIELTSKAFQSAAEVTNFGDSANAVKKINSFVEEQTLHKIKDLLQTDSVSSDTMIVLVNAIYVKGKWQHPFSTEDTYKTDFLYGNNTVQVDMMHMHATVRYGVIPDLDASALILPYENSNLSMLFLLPNAVDGLESTEKIIVSGSQLNEINSKLENKRVDIYIPKFRIESEIDLKENLDGEFRNVFSGNVDFSGLVQNNKDLYISEAKHKAFIDVNEAGSEAAASTTQL